MATFVAAATNFGIIFVENWRAASASGTHVVNGYEITICYFGPPLGFYPRFFVFASLLFALVGVFRRTFPHSIIATMGVAAALSAYIFWWLHSYRVFKNFTDVDLRFLNNPEVKQVSYLYNGTWFDVCVAASLAVSFVLLVDRLLNRNLRGMSVPPNNLGWGAKNNDECGTMNDESPVPRSALIILAFQPRSFNSDVRRPWW